MADSRVFRWAGWILGGTVLVAFVVVLVVLLVKKSKDNNDTADSTGSRVTDSLQFVVFVSSHPST